MNIKSKIKNCINAAIRATKEKEIQPVIVSTDKEKLLAGKVALIMGDSSGIGLAIAKAFQNSGVKVIIAGTNQERLEKALSQMGARLRALSLMLEM